MTKKETKGRILTGQVVSTKMDRTVVIEMERRIKHPLYKKYVKRYTRVKAHDADNVCEVGQTVTVRECRPLSKTKSWTLVQVHEGAKK